MSERKKDIRAMYEDLVSALRQMKVETGSFACLGCGHEHNCSLHGCAILRNAEAAIKTLRDPWCRPEIELPSDSDTMVLVIASGKPTKEGTGMGLIDLSKLKGHGWELSRFTGSSVFSKIETRNLDSLPTVDPIHYAGGCYCRECEWCRMVLSGRETHLCTKGKIWKKVKATDFCSFGSRREDADG